MSLRTAICLVISAIVLGACGAPETKSVGDQNQPPARETKRPDDAALKSDAKPAQPSSEKGAIDESLRHDGFLYSGLGSDKPVRYRLVRQEGAAPETGEQVSKLKESQDGRAVYTVERTGGLSVLGTDELLVDSKGVYTTKSSLGEMDSKNLELPAKVEPGATWKERHTLTQPSGEKVTIESSYKVVGTEKVRTELGTFDALLVTAKGPVEVGSQKMTLSAKTWYVKEKGPVKLVVVQDLGGKKTTMTMEMVP